MKKEKCLFLILIFILVGIVFVFASSGGSDLEEDLNNLEGEVIQIDEVQKMEGQEVKRIFSNSELKSFSIEDAEITKRADGRVVIKLGSSGRIKSWGDEKEASFEFADFKKDAFNELIFDSKGNLLEAHFTTSDLGKPTDFETFVTYEGVPVYFNQGSEVTFKDNTFTIQLTDKAYINSPFQGKDGVEGLIFEFKAPEEGIAGYSSLGPGEELTFEKGSIFYTFGEGYYIKDKISIGGIEIDTKEKYFFDFVRNKEALSNGNFINFIKNGESSVYELSVVSRGDLIKMNFNKENPFFSRMLDEQNLVISVGLDGKPGRIDIVGDLGSESKPSILVKGNNYLETGVEKIYSKTNSKGIIELHTERNKGVDNFPASYPLTILPYSETYQDPISGEKLEIGSNKLQIYNAFNPIPTLTHYGNPKVIEGTREIFEPVILEDYVEESYGEEPLTHKNTFKENVDHWVGLLQNLQNLPKILEYHKKSGIPLKSIRSYNGKIAVCL